jgi:hypothetical protein
MLDAPFIISCCIARFPLSIATFHYSLRAGGHRSRRFNKKMALQNTVDSINCRNSDKLNYAIQFKMMESRSGESLANSRGLEEPIVQA